MEKYLTTYTGKQFYFLKPTPEQIDIEDIAQSLSMQCRYNGHCKQFFSVAEHSINVANELQQRYKDPQLALEGLLHDAAEAYITDVIRPIKHELGDSYTKIEKPIESAVFTKYNLHYPIDMRIKKADNQWLFDEANVMVQEDISNWFGYVEPRHFVFKYYPPSQAKAEFLQRFNVLSVMARAQKVKT